MFLASLGGRAIALLLLAATSACATSAVRRGAVAISDADREARHALALEAQIDAARIPARSFTVLPFAVAAPDTLLQPLGFAMADFLTADLSHTSQLEMVERQRSEAILRELDLVDRGVVDPRTAPRVGRLVGARRLLIGDVSRGANGDIVVSARVVDAIAGTVAPLLTGTAPIARIIDAEKALAFRVFEELGITLTPSERASVEQRQTTNVAAAVAYGRGVQAEARGDAASAVAAFQEAMRLDATFAAARAQLAAAPPAVSTRAGGLQRVLSLSAQAINAPAPTRLPEAVDVPLRANILTFILTIRVF
ncbi:MAG TPA: CsgG/HfaB family protein [Gemmatimonadaceae bacterium]|nr:CsgG/HfaB family protein [Gemmatimonadaceae bacterium]